MHPNMPLLTRAGVTRLVATLAAAGLLALAGCFPDTCPYLSPDGKYIARVPSPQEAGATTETAVDLLTVATGQWQRVQLPDHGSAKAVFWLDGRLLVHAKHPPADPAIPRATDPAANPPADATPPTPTTTPNRPVERWWRVDPAKPATAATATDLPVFPVAFFAQHDGQRCLGLTNAGAKQAHLYRLDTFAELATVDVDGISCGDGWRLAGMDVDKPANEWNKTLKLIKPDSSKACTLDTTPLVAVIKERRPGLVSLQLDADHRRLLLVFGDLDQSKQWSFGLFDTATGKLQWQRTAARSRLWIGEPAVVGDTVYHLEDLTPDIDNPDQKFSGVLVQFTADQRTVICTLPTQEGDSSGLFTVAPDHKQFVVWIQGDNPRVILVPIADKVDAKALKIFPQK